MGEADHLKSGNFRIAVVTHPFHDETGRATLGNLVRVLEPLSEEMYLVTGEFPDWPNERVHVIRLKEDVNKGILPFRILQLILADLKAAIHLVRLSRHIEIVMFYIGTDEHLISTVTSRLLRKNTVACVPGLFSRTAQKEYGRLLQFVADMMERVRFFVSDQIAVESPTAARYLGLEKYGKKISASGARYVRTELFTMKKDQSSRANTVGYVGRLVEGKGLAEFVAAMPVILESRGEVKFLIGGGGPLFDEVSGRVQAGGLQGAVTLSGWIRHDDVPTYLNDLKLFVLPSEGEGLPGGVQEAMACGTVVLATAVGGIPDLIKDGETGFILENGSSECIARNVLRALESPRLDEIALNGRRLIEQEYGYEAMVEKYRQSLARLPRR